MRAATVSSRDLIVACAASVLVVFELVGADEWAPGARWPQVVGVTLAAAALAFRRANPLLCAVLVAGAVVGVCVLSEPPQVFALGLLLYLLLPFSLAASLEGVRLAGAMTLAAGAIVVRDLDDPRYAAGDFWVDLVIVAAAAGAGLVVRRRLRQIDHVARVGSERADDAVKAERARIARELHDVIAHGLSVIIVQADSARQALPSDHGETAAALEAIERAGRESLREMRRLLGLLREDVEEGGLAPQPGLHQLPELVKGLRRTGLPVDVEIDGVPVALSPGTDLVAFRIVQEALTNVLRHAGPTRARVRVSYTEREVRLEVRDSGRGAERSGDGRGLIGMRERARLYGGSLTTDSTGSGFTVTALLPLDPGGSATA